ncbi:IPT/TIG domain-containing protein [Streptomyces shenzhenensis]|uniref:IPT/TIG domain-containing protein n=1 Tax=Streptomyces shenzhenensis TaxID=943815 RepID=UPI0015F102C8|nr:IPT/TIG domain-containing protein [Streptomyces shenzhenensis]
MAAPVVTSVSPSQGSSAGGTTVTINGSGLTGAVAVRFGSALASNVVVVSDTQITATTPAGAGTVDVTVTGPGGTSTQTVTFTYTAAPAPSITSLVPSSGAAAGGTTVVINGTNLSGATLVLFGASPGAITNVTPTQVTVITPAGSGTVNVTVTTPGGVSNALPYTYTFVPAPVIDSVNPSAGPMLGGNTVVITGTDLAGTTLVLFGFTPAVIDTVTPTEVTVTAPPGLPSTMNVTVTTPGGVSNPLPYTYVAAPVVFDVEPHFGPDAGGNDVVISGSNLTLTTAVDFGPNPATAFTVDSDNQVTATAPAGTGTVVVTVTTPGGTSTVTPGDPYYTYLGTPVITSLTPDTGSTSGGDSITIIGSNLTFTDAVTFGGDPGPFTVVSDTIVVATAPAHAAGSVSVQVHTPAGNSNALPFTYV